MTVYNPTPMARFANAKAEDVNRELAKIQAAFAEVTSELERIRTGTVETQPLYMWRAWANNSTGTVDFTTDASLAPEREYIGFAFNRLVVTPSNYPEDYAWSPTHGVVGNLVSLDTLNVAGRPAISILDDLNSMSLSLLAYQYDRQTLRDYVDDKLFVDGVAVNTVIEEEQYERITADSATAATIALIGAKNLSGSAFVLDMTKVYVDPSMSLATRLTNMVTATADAQASVQELAETITTENFASATDLALLGAKNLSGTAFNLNMATVRVSPTETLSQYINTQVAAAAGGAASVAVIYDATITPTGGASAKAVLQLDVNGKVVGYAATNTNGVGVIRFKFDSYIIEGPDGSPLFIAEGGVVKMPNVEIDRLKVGTVTTGALAQGAVTNTVYNKRTTSLYIPLTQTQTIINCTIEKASASSIIEVFAYIPCTSPNDLKGIVTMSRSFNGGAAVDLVPTRFEIISDAFLPTALPVMVFEVEEGLAVGNYRYEMRLFNFGDNNSNITVDATARIKVTEIKR